jgi:hypothetical protein
MVEMLESATVKETSEGGYCPLVRCEECQGAIPHPHDGKVLWEAGDPGTYVEMEFVHEGCLEEHRKRRGVRLRTAGLEDFLESAERFASGGGS